MAPWLGRYSTGPMGVLCLSRGKLGQDAEDVANSACEAIEVAVYWVLCMTDFLMSIILSPYYKPTSNCMEQFSPADTVQK